jgi:hypothetical protein
MQTQELDTVITSYLLYGGENRFREIKDFPSEKGILKPASLPSHLHRKLLKD